MVADDRRSLWRTLIWTAGSLLPLITFIAWLLVYAINKYDLKADKVELVAVEQRSIERDKSLKEELLRRADSNYNAIQCLLSNQLETNKLLGEVLGAHDIMSRKRGN